MKQKPHARADRQRSRQRPQEQALHGRDGAHQRAAFGHRAVLHQHRRQRLPRPQGSESAGLGLLRVRQGHCRPGCGRPHRARSPPATAASTRTCRPRTSSSSAPRKRPDARAGRGRGAMKPTLFISDLHLSAARPAMVDAFERFCAGQAREATELYVLGDLFDTWAGDEQLSDPMAAGVAAALAGVAAAGMAVAVMRGNRDLLLGERFAAAVRCEATPGRDRRRRRRDPDAAPARRHAVHRRRRIPALPGARPRSGAAAALPRAALGDPSRDRRRHPQPQPPDDPAQAREHHGRQCGRGRGGFRRSTASRG